MRKMNSKGEFPRFPKFKLACLGGTFDHFHKGHEVLLGKAFEVSQKVIIGLTSDKFAKSKVLSQAVLPFKKRREELKNFLKRRGWSKRAQIVKIEGSFDPRILDPKIECLVVSERTKKKAWALNTKRIENSLSPLKIIVAPFISNKNGRHISSTRIRLGEIDRRGEPLVCKRFFKKTFFLPKNLRPVLKKPFGELILGSGEDLPRAALKLKRKLKRISFTFLITVGDIVTLSLIKEGVFPHLSIIDLKVGRKEVYQDIAQLGFSSKVKTREVENRPGTLSPALFLAIQKWVKEPLNFETPFVIKVLGEEDLSVLPAVLLSPLNSVVCYGQPERGIVFIFISEEKKQEVKKILHKFQEKERG